MTTYQWKSIESKLEQAWTLSPANLDAALSKWYFGDSETLGLARSLFQLSSTGTRTSHLPPEFCGWRPILSLGCGLNSKDYLVERCDDDTYPLAILHLGKFKFPDNTCADLFRNELRHLDTLNDPAFGQIFDAGLDESNRPYIVNQFLAGTPILDEMRGLDTRGVVMLFRRLLLATGHAHSRQVFHGNLNPSNILIGKNNQLLLPGFATQRVLALGSNGSNFMLNPSLSPADILYSSPEQLQGQANSPASDIYTLGVLLYNFLTGTPPYGNKQETTVELARLIFEVAPSQVLNLDTPLNRILQKALAKDPDSRYQNLTAFTNDIEQYLYGQEPVPAAPSRIQQAALWSSLALSGRRNWLAIMLCVAAFGVSALAIFNSANAKVEAGEILKTTESIFAKERSAKNSSANLSSVQLAKNYLDQMLAENPTNPMVQRELAAAYQRLAEAEMKGFGSLIVDRGLALQSSRRAYELTVLCLDRSLATAPLSDLQALEYARSAHTFIKMLKEAKNYTEAIRVAQEWQNRFSNIASSNIEVIRASALANTTMADLLFESGMVKNSLDSARSAMTQYEVIYNRNQTNLQSGRDYASSARSVGTTHLALNQPKEAIQAFKVAEKVLRVETEKPRPETAPLIDLARTLVGLGEALESTKQPEKAFGIYLESRLILQDAYKRESGNDEVKSNLAESLIHTARFQVNSRNFADAIKDSDQAIEILRMCLARLDGSPAYRRQLARALSVKASVLLATRRNGEAKQVLADAFTQWEHFSRTNDLGPVDKEEVRKLRLLGRA